MNIDIAWPWLFVALPLPLLVARWWPTAQRPVGNRLRLPFYAALDAQLDHQGERGSRVRLALAALAWLLLVLACVRPQFVGEPIALPVEGRELMLAVDISGSMRAEDMRLGNRVTDRLTAVKVVGSDFIKRREGDRIGLILFGRQAYLQTPLSYDRATVTTLLGEAAVGLAGKETAIGDAIGLAVKRLRERPEGDRVLILMTDGSNTAGSIDPVKATQLATDSGVRIYTIGVGGARRGLFGGGAELDEPALKAIAKATGGRYFRARDVQSLAAIYALLDQLEPVNGGEKSFRPRTELYMWPLSVAFLLSVLLVLARLLPLRGHRTVPNLRVESEHV